MLVPYFSSSSRLFHLGVQSFNNWWSCSVLNNSTTGQLCCLCFWLPVWLAIQQTTCRRGWWGWWKESKRAVRTRRTIGGAAIEHGNWASGMFHAREKQKKGIPEAKLLFYVLKFFSFVWENSAQQEERRSRCLSSASCFLANTCACLHFYCLHGCLFASFSLSAALSFSALFSFTKSSDNIFSRR